MSDYIIIDQPDPYARVPALAERLGVKEGEDLGTVDIHLKDGRRYSLFALINAFLDRVEKATEGIPQR